jgi:hypothetical protein
MAYCAGAAALTAAAYFGGWYWALLTAIVLAMQWRVEWSAPAVALTISTSLLWLAMFAWTEDRRMFFPFAMHLAVMMGWLLKGRARRAMVWGPALVVGAFTAIRVAQAATAEVLAVELAVAVAAIAAAVWAGRWGRLAAAMVGSLVAFAGLVL